MKTYKEASMIVTRFWPKVDIVLAIVRQECMYIVLDILSANINIVLYCFLIRFTVVLVIF